MTLAKFLRIQKRLSQKQLSKLTKVIQSNLSYIENRRMIPTDAEAKAIGLVLGCPPDRLHDLVDERKLGLLDGAAFRDAQQEATTGGRS